MARETGVVKFFLEQKGYGFCVPDDGTAEVFIHKSDFGRGLLKLEQANRISYEIALSDKGNGRKAVNIQRVV